MRLNTLRHIVTCLLAVLTLVGCKPKMPSYVISESKMEAILYDYHIAQSIAETGNGDVERDRYLYVQSVLVKHGVSEADFDSSMIYYNTHPKMLSEIYTRLTTRYEAEAKSLGVGLTESQILAAYSQYGDTANVWSGEQIMYLRNDGLKNLKTLTMKCDTTFRAGDSFRLSFMANFLTAGQNLAYAFLTVHYKDGTKTSQYRRINGSWEMSIPIEPADTFLTKVPKSISITFFHQPDDKGQIGYFFITTPSLLRMHKKVEPMATAEDEKKDSLDADAPDSAAVNAPSGEHAERAASDTSKTRMTPEEFRNSLPVERRINVVKERPIIRRPNPNHRQGGGLK